MGILDSVGHAMMDNDELHFSPTPSEDQAERWLINLSAPLSAFNGDWLDDVHTGKDDEHIREGVQSMWNVRDRASFEETARWLTQEGHRGAYEPIWRAILSIDEVRRNTPGYLRALFSMTFPAYYQMKVSRQLDYELLSEASDKSIEEINNTLLSSDDLLSDLRDDLGVPPEQIKSLLAWDAVRLASLSRWAVQLGYIRPEEFARYAGGLTTQLRQTYGSWAQLSAAYVAAGFIWNPSESRRENLTRTNRMLLKEGKSPYRKVAWQ